MDEDKPAGPVERTQPHFYRKADGGYVRPALTRDWVSRLAERVPSLGDGSGRWYGLALLILEYVFGYRWVERQILDEPKAGFLARALKDTDSGSSIVMHRVRDLAELVVNLLPVRGVEAPLDQLAAGLIEPGYAELETGKLLMMHGILFRFIWPSGKPGENFDLEIQFPDGSLVCADTKCKLETGTSFSSRGLLNTLSEARRRNLPKGYPCAIFVKIPQKWFESAADMSEAEVVCQRFLGDAKRIVCIMLYASMFALKVEIIHDWLAGKTIRSHVHDFAPTMTDTPLWTEPASLPKGWIRLNEFYR